MLLAMSLFLLGLAPAQAEWRSLQAEHFYVHYRELRRAVAVDVVQRAEAVHALLAERTGYVPQTRTHVVLWDGTDSANGYATPLFENQIGFYLTLPSLADQYLAGFPASPDDWLTLLLLHEYAHILHLDLRSEAAEKVTSIFGRIPLLSSPLLMTPPFLLEGFAVYHESLHGGGRGSGTYYDMFLRAAVLADRVPRVDQVLGQYSLGRWQPGGHTYFYGYFFLHYLQEKYGAELLHRLNEELMHRPDSLAGALRNVTGISLESLWAEWLEEITERTRSRIARLTETPATDLETYDTAGYHVLFPTPSPDGAAVAYVAVGGTGSQLRIFDLARGKERQVLDSEAVLTTTIAWHPDGDSVVVAEAQLETGGLWVSQLVEVEVPTGKKRPLPGTQHAFSPTFDGSGTRLAYIKRDGLATELRILDWTSGDQQQIALPDDVTLLAVRWAPSGDLLALSMWDREHGGYLALFDLKHGTLKPLLGGGRAIYDPPSWRQDGKALLFATDRSGIFNVYMYELETRRLVRLTHTLTGLFYPMESAHGEVTAMVYTADGYRLARLGEVMEQPGGPLWLPPPTPALLPEVDVQIEDLGRYTPWATLRPTFWLPSVSYSARESLFQVYTAGQDVLGWMGYTASAGMSFTTGQPLYNVQWQQQLGEGTGLTLLLGARRAPQLVAMGGTWRPYDVATGSVGLEWRRPVGRGAYSLWITLDRSTLQSQVSEIPTVSMTELVAGLRHSQAQSYFDWQLARELRLEVKADPADGDAWAMLFDQHLQLGHVEGHGVSARLLAGLAGSGQAIRLGASGSSKELELALRGYRTLAHRGHIAWAGTVEGSVSLARLNRGVMDTPVFLRDVRLHPFVEVGWTRAYGAEHGAVAFSFGAELGLRTSLGFGATGVDWRVGIARGAGEPGPHLYLRMVSNF